MKPIKDLFLFLILEVFSVVWAALVFSLIHNKLIAGLLASSYFLIFSLFIAYRILHWPKWWEAWSLYPLVLFLFGCTMPMIWERFIRHPNLSFEQIRIWGIPGPEFHHISSSVLGLLFLVTLAETVSEIFRGRAKA